MDIISTVIKEAQQRGGMSSLYFRKDLEVYPREVKKKLSLEGSVGLSKRSWGGNGSGGRNGLCKGAEILVLCEK